MHFAVTIQDRFSRSGRMLVREQSLFSERNFMGEYFQRRKYEKCMNLKHEDRKFDKVMSRRGKICCIPKKFPYLWSRLFSKINLMHGCFQVKPLSAFIQSKPSLVFPIVLTFHITIAKVILFSSSQYTVNLILLQGSKSWTLNLIVSME